MNEFYETQLPSPNYDLKKDNAKKKLESSQHFGIKERMRIVAVYKDIHALLTLNSIRNAMAIRVHCVAMLMACR